MVLLEDKPRDRGTDKLEGCGPREQRLHCFVLLVSHSAVRLFPFMHVNDPTNVYVSIGANAVGTLSTSAATSLHIPPGHILLYQKKLTIDSDRQ